MDLGPRIDSYDWRGGREAMLRWGPDDGPVVVVALPLFEEANRCRAFAASICRALAELGVGSAIPDMPGQAESLVGLDGISLIDLESAHSAATGYLGVHGRPTYAISIRSGALLDMFSPTHGRWQLAPQDGPSLLRDLTRNKRIATGTPLSELWFAVPEQTTASGGFVEVAGNFIATSLLVGLLSAEWPTFDPATDMPLRVVRLTSDSQAADRRVNGTPLWRQAEPRNDVVLCKLLATDIVEWIATCEG